MKMTKSLAWIIALVGVWELASPFISGMTAETASLWRIYITGLALILCGGMAAMASQPMTIKYTGWTSALLGLWLIIAPFALDYAKETLPMWNDVLAGMMTLTSGTWMVSALNADKRDSQD